MTRPPNAATNAGRVRSRRRTAHLAVAAALAAGLVLGGGVSASAWWQARQDVTASASAGVVAAPTGLTCTTTGNVLARTATLRWTGTSPPPAQYVMTFTAGSTTTTYRTTGTEVVVSEGLLGGLLTSLLDLLLGGTPVVVTVQAEHTSGWRSTATTSVMLRGALISGQGATGVVCA